MKKNISAADLAASFVVFIVAVPLSLGIALASGAPIAAGLIAAMVGGIVVGVLSGAPLMVSGPAAGLTVLVYQIVQTHGIAGLAFATVVAGACQIAIGAARSGRFFNYIPRGVINGMLAAIGFVILLGQMHVMLGAKMPSNPIESLMLLPTAMINSLATMASLQSVVVGMCVIGTLVYWRQSWEKVTHVPSALIAVIVGVIVAIPTEIPKVKVESIIDFSLSALNMIPNWPISLALVGSGIGLAVVASAESLLTAKAVEIMSEKSDDEIVRQSGKASFDKELFAQGFGNIASGLLGGLPITGVIVRSAANMDAGAKTRWSAVLHGAWVAVFVIAIPFVIEMVPLAALAAILIVTGIKLLNLSELFSLLKARSIEGTLWVFTLAAIVITDLLSGLALGIGFSALAFYVFKYLLKRPEHAQEILPQAVCDAS